MNLQTQTEIPLPDEDATLPGLEPKFDTQPHQATIPFIDERYPTLALEDFHWIQKLGMGGIAEVWKVEHPSFEEDIALKVVRSEWASDAYVKAQFERERKAFNLLKGHWGMVRHLAYGQSLEGRFFIVMEEIKGGSMATWVRHPAPWNFLRIAFVQLCEILHYIHQRDVLHRDLKASNILIDSIQKHLKLTDFGLALFEKYQTRTKVSKVLGTPAYMAPEQALGWLDELGPHTDLYTFGIVMYELLSGHKPFEIKGKTDQEIMKMHCEYAPKPLEVRPEIEAPEGIVDIVHRLLAKKPQNRYGDAYELRSAILDL